jgi:uncharacterized protein (TIGR03435 family)
MIESNGRGHAGGDDKDDGLAKAHGPGIHQHPGQQGWDEGDQYPTGEPQGAASEPTDRAQSTLCATSFGLKLESARGPAQILVIDRVEGPSED